MACAVINKSGKLLLLKRSPTKKLFPNKWFVVGAAPLTKNDNMKSIALREIKDELGGEGHILAEGQEIEFVMEGREWVIVPFLASINTDTVTLNNEHTEFKWIETDELDTFDTIPNTLQIVQMLLQKYNSSKSE